MRYIIWLLLFSAVVIRVFYYQSHQASYPDGTKIRINKKLTYEPIRYPNSQYFRLSGYKIYLPAYPEVFYGDFVSIEGVVSEDVLKSPALVTLKENRGVLYTLRKNTLSFFEKNLPHPHSALVAGMTIGSKSGLGQEFWETLKKTGTAHVVVASGMNVTLVARFLIAVLLLVLPRRKALPLALVGIWTYAVFSGFDAPIIRAAVMGSITFTAQELGRIYYAWRSLVLSAAGMLLIRPEWAVDLGFILSFAATASLMLFERKVYRMISKVPKVFREDISTSLAAQVGVAPILLAFFGQFNLLSPLINAAILWTVVPITVIGFFAGAVGLIFEPLGAAVLLLTYPLTSWFIWIVKISST